MKMVDRSGNLHEVPDDQVQGAFQSGQLGFVEGSTIPVVTEDGQAGRVDATDAEHAFSQNARIALPHEIKAAERHEKYGEGVGNHVAAAAEAFGRGITGGFGDPLAIGVSKALFGQEAADATREHLAGEKEEHPLTAGAFELAGMAAPLLIPGGAAVEGAELAARAAQGAEAVGGAAKLAEGAGAVAGALPEATAGLAKTTGLAAEGAAAATEAADATAIAKAAEQGAADVSRTKEVAKALGEGVRKLGAVPRGIAAAGHATERVLAGILGKEASSTAGKIAQKIVAKGGGMAAEGALFGLSDEIDEAALGDEDLNAEKLIMAAGHGALLAGAMGGVLTGGGELAREVVGRSSPYLRKLAGLQMWKAAVPAKSFSEKALLRLGGAAAVGETALEHGVAKGANTVEDLLVNATRAAGEKGQMVGTVYASSPATTLLEHITRIFDDEIGPLEKKALHGKIVASLKAAKAEVISQLVPEIETEVAAKAPASKVLSQEELKEWQAWRGDVAKGTIKPTDVEARMQERGWTVDEKTGLPERAMPKVDPKKVAEVTGTTPIPIAKLIEQRQALGDMAYKESKALDPNLRVEHLRNIVGKLGDLETTAMDKANVYGMDKAALKKMRVDYQRLVTYKEALQKTNARYATNNNFSIRDWGVGLVGLASGHPMGAIAGTLATKFLRERGPTWSAQVLDKLSTLGAIEHATAAADRDINRGVSNFFKPGEKAAPRVRLRTFTGPAGEPKAEYEGHRDDVARAAAYANEHAAHVESVAETIADHAPNTAKSVQKSALDITAWLANQLPKSHVQMHPLTAAGAQDEEPRVSDAEKFSYVQKARIAHDPIGTTFDRLNKGMLTKENVNTLKTLYPKTYDQIKQQAIDELGSQTKKLTFDKRMQLGILLELPPEQALEPMFVKSMQQTFAEGSAAPAQAGEPKGGPSKRQLKATADSAGLRGQ